MGKKSQSRDKNKAMARFIRRARIERGLLQTELADALGVDKSTVNHWEKGVSSPRVNKFEDLASALDVPVSELVQRVLKSAA